MTISRNLSILAESVNTSGQVSLTTGVSGTLPVANGGTGTTSTTFVNLATNVTGTLPIANGGTNSTATATAGGVGYGTGTAYAFTAAGTSGQALLSGGAGAPTWGNVAAFAAGTKMLFVQTAAPTGWTKDTTNNNNSAIRIVTGTASTGGTVAFTTAFASQGVSGSLSSTTATNASFTPAGTISVSGSVGSYTLATNEIPGHYHIAAQANDGGVTARYGVTTGLASTRIDYDNNNFQGTQGGNSSTVGGGGSHSHSFSGSGSFSGTAATPTQNAHTHTFTGTAINLAVQYVDVIVATKD
jgi:hypothetical protein